MVYKIAVLICVLFLKQMIALVICNLLFSMIRELGSGTAKLIFSLVYSQASVFRLAKVSLI